MSKHEVESRERGMLTCDYIGSAIPNLDLIRIGVSSGENEVRRRTSIVLLLILIGVCLYAQEEEPFDTAVYGLGDQTFSISAGPMLPLFLIGADGALEVLNGHLKIGATAALQWGAFLGNSFSIGAELSGMFAQTVLKRTLINVPVTAVFTYSLRFYPFEVLFHGGLGINLLRLDSDLYVGPIIKPGASMLYDYNSEWAFGLKIEYLFIPELYVERSNVPKDESTFGNFLSITLSTLYHF